MDDAIGAGPATSGRGGRKILDFGGRAGGKRKIDASGAAGKGLESGGAGFVVRTDDAANGAGECDIGHGHVANESGESGLKSYGACGWRLGLRQVVADSRCW